MPNIVNVGYHSTNYYAIDVKGGKLLVDCGWPRTLPQFTAELKRKGIAPTDIKYILATHFHPDHAGLVEEFKAMGAKLILLETQTGALEADDPKPAGTVPSFVKTSLENNMPLKFAESRAFLASLGLSGEVVPTPGHSSDSITLILDDGSAFTGDLPPRFMVAEDDTLGKASWAELDRRHVTKVFPAHGG